MPLKISLITSRVRRAVWSAIRNYGGGCSGYKYIIELENEPDDTIIFEQHGIQVFVNTEHMEKLKNSTIDWVETLMESGFKIENPQAKRPCGCGESVDF